VAPEKRLDLLLAAFRDIRSAEPGAALVIVGDGPMLPELQRCNEAGVHFTGYRTGAALAEAYAAADVFVFPSDTETFGNVVLEAAASGVAVVAPARGGVTDTVQHGVTGLLVPPGDSGALAAATLRLLRDDALRVQLGARGRAAALERSWDGILDGVLAGYAEAAGATGIPRVA
jgi:glycosyltransferase involved in cell wall biosynthesis